MSAQAPRRFTPVSVAGLIVLAGLLVAIPFLTTTTSLRQATQIVVSVLAVLGVNIATGYGGMISLGHGVFVGDCLGLGLVAGLHFVLAKASVAVFGLNSECVFRVVHLENIKP